MRIQRVLTGAGAILIWAVSLSGLALAQDSALNVSQVDVQPVPAPIEWDRKCVIVDENLLKKAEMFRERRAKHLEKYTAVVEKFNTIIQKLNDADFDTSSLESLIPELDRRITVFADTSEAFILELESAANKDTCNAYSIFVVDLEESRAGLKGTRLAASDIRQYVIDVFIPEVRELIE